jgi:hypothetical protein
MHGDFISLLTLRRSAQVLGSSGKQTAHLLPTFVLRINEVGQKWEEEKICAVSKQKKGILFGGCAGSQEIYFG